MYMYACGSVKFADGRKQTFGETDGIDSVEQVEELALRLIREDEKRTFTISGTLNTDYSDMDLYAKYDGSECAVETTDYYWYCGMDDAWFEGDSDDLVENYCECYGIKHDSKAYQSLKKAFEISENGIYCNDDRTEFYADTPPYTERRIIFRDGEPCFLWEKLAERED